LSSLNTLDRSIIHGCVVYKTLCKSHGSGFLMAAMYTGIQPQVLIKCRLVRSTWRNSKVKRYSFRSYLISVEQRSNSKRDSVYQFGDQDLISFWKWKLLKVIGGHPFYFLTFFRFGLPGKQLTVPGMHGYGKVRVGMF
jgi:hypothetical protein